MIYQLIPREGLLPVTIGMTDEQLVAAIGSPSGQDWFTGEENLWFANHNLRVTIQRGKVIEASVSPPSEILFQGQSLFKKRGHWKTLVALEADPLESVGFVILKSLGVAFTGLHDGDRAQRAVTVFEAGRWDGPDAPESTPFRV